MLSSRLVPISVFPEHTSVLLDLLVCNWMVPLSIVQLLHKEKVRNSEGDETLMKILHGSVTSVIPAESRRFGRIMTNYWPTIDQLLTNYWHLATSITGRQVDPLEFAQVLSNCDDEEIHSDTIVLSFGCFSDGHAIPAYVSNCCYCLPSLISRPRRRFPFRTIR